MDTWKGDFVKYEWSINQYERDQVIGGCDRKGREKEKKDKMEIAWVVWTSGSCLDVWKLFLLRKGIKINVRKIKTLVFTEAKIKRQKEKL